MRYDLCYQQYLQNINLSTSGSARLIEQSGIYVNQVVNITGNRLAGTSVPYFQKAAGGDVALWYSTISGGGVGTTTNNRVNIANNHFTNVVLNGATDFRGIYSYPNNVSTGTLAISNNTVSNITGGTGDLILISGSHFNNTSIYQNTISNITGGGTINGIYLMNNAVAAAYRNKVTGINGTYANAQVNGIYANSASGTMNLYNNFLTDLTAPISTGNTGVNGIYAVSGSIHTYHNSIVLGKGAVLSGGANFSCAGIFATADLNLKNNIIYVNATASGTGTAACIRRNPGTITAGTAPTASAFAANHNVYYINPGAQNYTYVEGITAAASGNGYAVSGLTANATNNIVNDPQFNKSCGLYKTFMAANGEIRSFTENNVSGLTGGMYAPTDSSYAKAGGTPLTLVTDDFAGTARTNPPDIGALQFNGQVVPTPITITYTPVPNVDYCAAAPTLAATITAIGTNSINSTTAPPRVYYKKKNEANVFGIYPADNVATFNGWKYVSATGSGTSFSFAFDYTRLFTPIADQDTLLYFVIAEDNAAVPNTVWHTASFINNYCPTGVNITPAAGGVAAAPVVKQFIILPRPAFTISGSREDICVKHVHAITVTSPIANYSTYIWSPVTNLFTDAAATIPYAGTSITTVYTRQPIPGMVVYTATATDTTTLCTRTRTDTLIVAPEPFPVITRSANVLSTGLYTSYQWYLAGNPIPGATGQNYTFTTDGHYTVQVTSAGNCMGSSSVFIVKTGVASLTAKNAGILIYPNPAVDEVTIKAKVPVNVAVISVDGRVLLQVTNAVKIDVRSLPVGIYALRITDSSDRLLGVERLLKMAE